MVSPNPENDAMEYMERWAKNSGLLDYPGYTPRKVGWDFPFVSEEQKERFGLHGYVAAYIIPEDFVPSCEGRNWLFKRRTITRCSPLQTPSPRPGRRSLALMGKFMNMRTPAIWWPRVMRTAYAWRRSMSERALSIWMFMFRLIYNRSLTLICS